MNKKSMLVVIAIVGVMLVSVFGINGNMLNELFDLEGHSLNNAYDVPGDVVFPTASPLPVPSGDLTASSIILLPDIYGNGQGFTCTGLAYDSKNNVFLVGDIGQVLPDSGAPKSQIVKLSADFLTVEGTIPLYNAFPNMGLIQGVAVDTRDNTIWFCAQDANKIYHTNAKGDNLGNIFVASPTGIAYSAADDSFWVLTYASANNILRVSKTGTVLEQYTFKYNETLDQCFLDEDHGYLYITAGTNYTGRNNVYLFDINTHQQSIACTVDSYSVEGILIESDRMIIVNDGYYHSAYDGRNVANFYDLS